MSAEKKRRVGLPRHSTLLDKLAQHPDPRVRLFIGKFVAYQRPPADAPRLRAALKRLESGLTNLAKDKPSTRALVEQELTGLRLTIDAAATLESSDDELLPTNAWLKQFKIYGALLLVVDDDIAALRALAAEYLRSVHTGACSHANVANNIRLRSHSPGPEGESEHGSSRSWEGR